MCWDLSKLSALKGQTEEGERDFEFWEETSAGEWICSGFHNNACRYDRLRHAFFAALLHRLAHTNIPVGDLSAEELTSICRFANAVGALTSLKRGGAAAIPFPADVVRLLKRKNRDN